MAATTSLERRRTLAVDSQAVARRFGARWVLRGVSLSVESGEVVGLLGSNGSGKSTLLRVLATLLRPNAGSATVGGCDVVRDPDGARRQLGFLAHAPGLYDDLTARENLRFAADMLGGSDRPIEPLLDRVGLGRAANDRVRGFSAGMQRRLALARLLLASPLVLLLDEPYSNLDVEGIALMNAVLQEHVARGGAAIVVLHELAPASGILHRTVTLENGRLDAPGVAV
ncbi:MAG: heme ABC exporter ATP-binding protein CcmA [Gemmatimonadaceae bacterium]|nr:heme ABC exporter ATP-binding protein CcmA [Gemmatimonadaceae bacterium]